MAKIDDLLEEVGDAKLRAELRRAVKELRNSRNFGLVFEEHIPEEVALPGLPVRQGSLVQIRTRPDDTTKYEVVSLNGTTAAVRPVGSDDDHTEQIDTADLMVVRRFGEPIYPGLTEVDSIRRGPDSKPAHAVINAENFHALQLLTYTHAGKVDVIYIDPPYNTGARDWKYNNRYVDANDQWRHSKWLSMMEKRLKLAKQLLKQDGVLIVTIDEHEVHHLRTLLEQLFPEYRHQIITIVTNPKGVDQSGFSRVEEYALYVLPPGRQVNELPIDFLRDKLLTADSVASPWLSLLRRGNNSRPADRPNL
ncbi:MAG TPA: DNA methyltransferase, partial [Acidimicrobiia bacterium]|nr:DNA methyltransferase [Acidimicrobiia bacterium]